MGKLPFSFERKREGNPQPTILCVQAKLLTENEKERIITINAERRREERSPTSVDSRMRHSHGPRSGLQVLVRRIGMTRLASSLGSPADGMTWTYQSGKFYE